MKTLQLALVLTLLAPASAAETVTYLFTGVVDESVQASSGIFAFASDGTLLSGSISFDDRLLDRVAGNQTDEFFNFTPVQNKPYTEAFRMEMTVGGLTVTQVATEPNLAQAALRLDDANPGSTDSVIYSMLSTSPTVRGNDIIALRFIDTTGVGVGTGGSGLTGTIEGAIAILDALDVSLFPPTAQKSFWLARDDVDQTIGTIQWNATSLTRAPRLPASPSLPWLLPAALLVTGSSIALRRVRPAAERSTGA
jgi:hypothetical protein